MKLACSIRVIQACTKKLNIEASMSYIALKHAHMGLAYLTVILFIFRGVHRLVPTSSPASLSQRVFDYVSYAVAIPLLVLSLMLLSTLQINPAITPWIGTKLVWLVVYIVLGVFAYRPRSEEHTSELQSRFELVFRLL